MKAYRVVGYSPNWGYYDHETEPYYYLSEEKAKARVELLRLDADYYEYEYHEIEIIE